LHINVFYHIDSVAMHVYIPICIAMHVHIPIYISMYLTKKLAHQKKTSCSAFMNLFVFFCEPLFCKPVKSKVVNMWTCFCEIWIWFCELVLWTWQMINLRLKYMGMNLWAWNLNWAWQMLKMANDEPVSLESVSVNLWFSLKTEIDSPLQMM
jgi:hypothetical protein